MSLVALVCKIYQTEDLIKLVASTATQVFKTIATGIECESNDPTCIELESDMSPETTVASSIVKNLIDTGLDFTVLGDNLDTVIESVAAQVEYMQEVI